MIIQLFTGIFFKCVYCYLHVVIHILPDVDVYHTQIMSYRLYNEY